MGWRNYSIIEGKLQIEDLTGEESVYLLPVFSGAALVSYTNSTVPCSITNTALIGIHTLIRGCDLLRDCFCSLCV